MGAFAGDASPRWTRPGEQATVGCEKGPPATLSDLPAADATFCSNEYPEMLLCS